MSCCRGHVLATNERVAVIGIGACARCTSLRPIATMGVAVAPD
jgi:hypothetical protein